MKRWHHGVLFVAVGMAGTVGSMNSLAADGLSAEEVVSVPLPGSSAKISSFCVRPLAFEPNVGQTDLDVKFLARGNGYRLFLTGREAVMVLNSKHFGTDAEVSAAPRHRSDDPPDDSVVAKAPVHWRTSKPGGDSIEPKGSVPRHDSHVLRMRLTGANASPAVTGDKELQGKVNYFIGNDPASWRTNVPTFGRVRWAEVYPGIDLVYYGNEGQLEYDFMLAPGADPNQIAMEFEGSERLELDPHGDLIAWVDERAVRWRKPVVYQESGGQRIEIAGGYRLNQASLKYQEHDPRRIGFELAAYDPAKPLVIDPALVYSTYLGGGGNDRPNLASRAIAADSQGNACVVGYTESLNFPVKNALQPQRAGATDAFVTKLSRSGELLFSTYLGGKGDEGASGVALDLQGNIHVAGGTLSTNFPLVNPLQATLGGRDDGFVAILSPDGAAMSFSTYWGGVGGDSFNGVALDPAGNIYLAGWSEPQLGSLINDFPVQNALQAQPAGGEDAVVVKLEAGGKGVIYSTYFGGSGGSYDLGESAHAIAADAEGFAYIVGTTASYDFPVVNAYQPSITGDLNVVGTPYSDFFYARITPNGSGLVYSSYFGSYGDDTSPDLTLGSHGELWLAGGVGLNSEGLATPGSFQSSGGGIVAQFNATNGVIEAATYVPWGGHSIAVDGLGDVWVGGGTGGDAFVAKLSSDCSRLLFSTSFGGSGPDARNGLSLCLDREGSVLLFGDTESKTNFPLVNAFQAKLNGAADCFVAKISLSEVLKISRSDQNLTLSWPAAAKGYQLESTSALTAGGSWDNVNISPVVVGNDQVVTVPIQAVPQFFHLRKL